MARLKHEYHHPRGWSRIRPGCRRGKGGNWPPPIAARVYVLPGCDLGPGRFRNLRRLDLRSACGDFGHRLQHFRVGAALIGVGILTLLPEADRDGLAATVRGQERD